MNDLDLARGKLLIVLHAKNETCWKEPLWGGPGRLYGHMYLWDPLDGQESFNAPGRYRVWCGWGCGYEREDRLTGEEIWEA